jgi:hypothetical protein
MLKIFYNTHTNKKKPANDLHRKEQDMPDITETALSASELVKADALQHGGHGSSRRTFWRMARRMRINDTGWWLLLGHLLSLAAEFPSTSSTTASYQGANSLTSAACANAQALSPERDGSAPEEIVS